MMQFGTYFAYWEPEWDADFSMYCRKAAKMGFDVLEISAGALAERSAGALAELRRAAAETGITLTGCIGLPEKYDLASRDSAVREKGLAYLERIFSAMEQVGMEKLGGIVYACWPYDYQRPFDKERAWDISRESVQSAAESAEEHGIILMLEVVNRFEHFLLNSAGEGVRFAREVGRKNVKLLLDTFHMNIEEDSIAGAIKEAGDLLGHFHIGECNRKVPGKGHMPWAEIAGALREISYEGAVVMEPFVRPGGTVGRDIKVWRDLSGEAEETELDAEIEASLRFVRRTFLC